MYLFFIPQSIVQSPVHSPVNLFHVALFHQRKDHSLKECKAFDEKTFQERSEWIQRPNFASAALKQITSQRIVKPMSAARYARVIAIRPYCTERGTTARRCHPSAPRCATEGEEAFRAAR